MRSPSGPHSYSFRGGGCCCQQGHLLHYTLQRRLSSPPLPLHTSSTLQRGLNTNGKWDFFNNNNNNKYGGKEVELERKASIRPMLRCTLDSSSPRASRFCPGDSHKGSLVQLPRASGTQRVNPHFYSEYLWELLVLT